MLKWLKSALGGTREVVDDAVTAEPGVLPEQLDVVGHSPLSLRDVLMDAGGLPVLNWETVQHWATSIPDPALQAEAWAASERTWLMHMRAALGAGYTLQSDGSALLLSSLSPGVARATLAYVNTTVQRVLSVLDGVAASPEWGHDILIVFDDEETYYRYVAHYYPEAGEYAFSSGMYINHGCGHFVTIKADLATIEPVIAHELTHACLAHLPIPAWLNEGLAVNTERRLCPAAHHMGNAPQMHARHKAFWGAPEIQEFWSGQSFLRQDEGHELSYDLARILVSQLSDDWSSFRAFALNANLADAASASARQHLSLELGDAVCALLERSPDPAWAPRPDLWLNAPEHGAFRY